MKKLLSILLTIALAFALLVPVFAEKTPPADGQTIVVLQAEDDLKEAPGWLRTIAIIIAVAFALLMYSVWPFIPLLNLVILMLPMGPLFLPGFLPSMLIESFFQIFGYTVFEMFRDFVQ